MVALPGVKAVMGTLMAVAPAAKAKLAGTVATAGFPELKFTARPPAGAGEARFNATFCVPGPFIVTVCDANDIVVVTCTDTLAGAYPVEVALIEAVP
jgi:hypothetical protein